MEAVEMERVSGTYHNGSDHVEQWQPLRQEKQRNGIGFIRNENARGSPRMWDLES